MRECEHSLLIHASPDAIFDYLSDIRNLSRLLPASVLTAASGSPRTHNPELYFVADPTEYILRWGVNDQNAHSGWLEICELGSISELTVHLSFYVRPDDARHLAQQDMDCSPKTQEDLEAALILIQNVLEGRLNSVGVPAGR